MSTTVQEMEEDSQETLMLGDYVPPIMGDPETKEAWLKNWFFNMSCDHFTLKALTSCSIIFIAQEIPDMPDADIPVATPCRSILKIPEACDGLFAAGDCLKTMTLMDKKKSYS